MAYIGNNLSVQQYAPNITYFSGNASTTAFTLPYAVVSAAQIIVTVENVIQNPTSAFTVSSRTLTFTSAPPTGTNNIWVEYTSLQTNTIQPSNGTVGSTQLAPLTTLPVVGGATLTLPTQTATLAFNGPAFSAYGSTTQSITNSTWTKVVLNNKEFDTNTNFDAVTNYRFTPTVAGYYQISGTIQYTATTTFPNNSQISLYKNGVAWKNNSTSVSSGAQSGSFVTVSSVIYLNGTTDYIELYGWMSGATGGQFLGAQTNTYLSGSMVRSA